MVGLVASRLVEHDHRAFDARAFVIEVRWMLEEYMLPVVQNCTVHRHVEVISISGLTDGCQRNYCYSGLAGLLALHSIAIIQR